MSIFKAYDIRGIYPSELNEDTAYKIGRAFVSFLKCKKVVIGRDCRNSSDSLFNALARGITDQGADIIDIGLSSSPLLYYACAIYGDSGIIVTASHNPKEYNGFKLCRRNAVPISGETGIKEIENLVKENIFSEAEKGNITKKEVLKEYVDYLLKFKGNISGLKIVADAGNAMACVTIPPLFKELDCEFIPLYFNLDGDFPNHEANPLNSETLKDLQKKVVEEKADFGVAFDGDADRCGFVDEKGEIIRNDLMTALIAEYLLEKEPNQKVLFDVRSSRIVKEKISEKGIPIEWKVGHAFIKNKMREENVLFAGELSGHFYFRENFFCESEAIPVLIVMNILCERKKKLSELILPLKKYFQSGEINSKVNDAEIVLKRLEAVFHDAKITKLDGLTVEFSDWFFNVRASNTEPLLRLNLEAKSKELMEEKRDFVLDLIKR